MNDVIPKLTGKVTLICRNVETGEIQRHGSNLVVNGLYSQLCYLVAGSPARSAIGKVEFGTGTGAAAVGDTAVTHLSPPVTVNTTVTYPTAASVEFTAVWGSAETNAASITEAGLLFNNNVLAARWLFGAVKKSAGWEWTIVWTLSFP
jgi:hypothetical protein